MVFWSVVAVGSLITSLVAVGLGLVLLDHWRRWQHSGGRMQKPPVV